MIIYFRNFFLFTPFQNGFAENMFHLEKSLFLADSLPQQRKEGKQPEDKYERHQTDEIR